ncbi:MAG: 16S rRNA (uracil(1498)-N(3))-methyltransferase [Lachnospiraceae bacterium]|nr:16S rRNA (uracil(1498)-N(3))-methyltransferase [Lachnospiraceae bacterium]
MYHFFIQAYQVRGDSIKIEGKDVNHIRNVLRMKQKEALSVTDEDGVEYFCEIQKMEEEAVWLSVKDQTDVSHELPAEIVLFQGLPKGDRMELIIQKAVELGIHTVVPMETRRCVVRLDEKKKETKCRRWNAIAESAAKQSKRSRIPQVHSVVTFQQALQMAEGYEAVCIPYEQTKGMQPLREFLAKLKPGIKAGFFIGPEGGFEEEEVQLAAEQGIVPVSLGKRILRTETAGIALLSVMMLQLEE